MPLEAVMVCIDNSDYTRNGDYAPSRFESQTDAVNLVCGAKTQQNPENSVGILATAGDRIEVMITPTTDLGKLVSELPKLTIGGSSDLLRGIQTAQLALKHRQNKNQKQRIIAFVGSPVAASERELEALGKNLKKNNVSLDLVSFGEVEENNAKLDKLLNAVNSNETSHMVEVPVGPKLLSDVLLSSVIINADGEGGAGAGGGEGFEFGINPNDDPELALALRISMEEERARQQQTAGGGGADGAGLGPTGAENTGLLPPSAAAAPPVGSSLPMATDSAVMEAMGMEDMDEELRQALLLSLQEAEPTAPPVPEAPPTGQADYAARSGGSEEAKAAAPIEATAPTAVASAVSPGTEQVAAATEPKDVDMQEDPNVAVDSKWFQDPSFVQELLGSLPGVDINDPRIQSALKEVGGEDKEEENPGESGAAGSSAGGKPGGSSSDPK